MDESTSTTKVMRVAACSCGELHVACEGEPVRVSLCHCQACQRRSGSAFGLSARWPAERVRLTGKPKTFVRVGEEGGESRFSFCPSCGVTVQYVLSSEPGMVAVPVGTFADPDFKPPSYRVYAENCPTWLDLHDVPDLA